MEYSNKITEIKNCIESNALNKAYISRSIKMAESTFRLKLLQYKGYYFSEDEVNNIIDELESIGKKISKISSCRIA